MIIENSHNQLLELGAEFQRIICIDFNIHKVKAMLTVMRCICFINQMKPHVSKTSHNQVLEPDPEFRRTIWNVDQVQLLTKYV